MFRLSSAGTCLARGLVPRLSPSCGYFHTFGRPIPELQHIGLDLRARLAAYRMAAGGPSSRAKGGG